MGYGFRIEVTGAYALFSRPELKVERVSYDCMTPSAACGILEAVFWRPAIKYVIDEIVVCNEIRFTNIRRNEVSVKLNARAACAAAGGSGEALYLHTGSFIQQRASTLLKDVRYVISAHFELTDKAEESDTKEKFYNMILRRLKKGQCFHQPYLGCREFPAVLRLLEEGEQIASCLVGKRDLGLMLYGMEFTQAAPKTELSPAAYYSVPTYFRAVLIDGVLDLRHCEVLR